MKMRTRQKNHKKNIFRPVGRFLYLKQAYFSTGTFFRSTLRNRLTFCGGDLLVEASWLAQPLPFLHPHFIVMTICLDKFLYLFQQQLAQGSKISFGFCSLVFLYLYSSVLLVFLLVPDCKPKGPIDSPLYVRPSQIISRTV